MSDSNGEQKVRRFPLRRRTEKIELELSDGAVEVCTITELTGAQRDQYVNLSTAKMKFDGEGRPVGVSDVTGMQANLIALCLTDSEGKQYDPVMIQTWPSATQTEVFKIAQELSGLGKLAEANAKNG